MEGPRTSRVGFGEEWADEFRLRRGRPIGEQYVYLFADGVYLKAGLERENTAVLVVLGSERTATRSCWRCSRGIKRAHPRFRSKAYTRGCWRR